MAPPDKLRKGSAAVADLTFERKSLGGCTIEELLQIADEFDAMAARTPTQDAGEALGRLATRFRIYAAERATRQPKWPVGPGAPARAEGRYIHRSVFGTPAGNVVDFSVAKRFLARRGSSPRTPSLTS